MDTQHVPEVLNSEGRDCQPNSAAPDGAMMDAEQEQHTALEAAAAAADELVGVHGRHNGGGVEPQPPALRVPPFPSIAAALQLPLPPGCRILGSKPPQEGRQRCWALQFKAQGKQGWVGQLEQQTTAVGADLVLMWRRCQDGQLARQPPPAGWTVPGAAYHQDEQLLRRLRRIRTLQGMQLFLGAVLRGKPAACSELEDEEAALHQSEDQQQGSEHGPEVEEKLGVQVGEGHSRLNPGASPAHSPEPTPAAAAAGEGGVPGAGSRRPAAAVGASLAAGLDLRSWEHGADGWRLRRLSATACDPGIRQTRLGMHVTVFEQLAGRPPEVPSDALTVICVESGRRYELPYRHNPAKKDTASYFQGQPLRALMRDGGYQVGDVIALKKEPGQVLVKRIPAGAAALQQLPSAQRRPRAPRKRAAAELSGRALQQAAQAAASTEQDNDVVEQDQGSAAVKAEPSEGSHEAVGNNDVAAAAAVSPRAAGSRRRKQREPSRTLPELEVADMAAASPPPEGAGEVAGVPQKRQRWGPRHLEEYRVEGRFHPPPPLPSPPPAQDSEDDSECGSEYDSDEEDVEGEESEGNDLSSSQPGWPAGATKAQQLMLAAAAAAAAADVSQLATPSAAADGTALASPFSAMAAAAPLSPILAADKGAGQAAGSTAVLQQRAAQAVQRKVEQALAAFADADSGDGMLRPLRLLVLANKGGATLRDVVRRWPCLDLAQQQELFEAALIISSHQDWGQLDEQLSLALEAAAS